MIREWSLGECVSKVIDYRGKTPGKLGGDWTETGYRVISAMNVHGGSIDNEDQIRCVSQAIYDKWMQDEIQRYDCFLASEGASLGENAIWDSDEKVVLGQRLYAIRTNPDILDPWYLAMYMQTKKFRDQVDQVSTGSTVFGISQPVLLSLKLLLPEIEDQRYIGQIYRSLKTKIANNTALCAVLEAMAKLIYDYWFVQFDFPDENGKPYKSSGGKMAWNEDLKREIPEGWEAGTFKDMIDIGNGRDHKTLGEGNIPVYGSGGLMRKANDGLYTGESVLIPRKGTLNNIMYVNETFWTVDTMFYTKMKRKHIGKYMYYATKLYDFERLNTGTGVPSMTTDIIYKLKVLIPDDRILRLFDTTLVPWYVSLKHYADENAQLTALRDFLLPMLMNGQVKVGAKGDLSPVAYPTDEIHDEYLAAAEPHKAYDAEKDGV